MTHLHLLIPHLQTLASLPNAPALPALARWLSKANNQTAAASLETNLAALFGITAPLPSAALTALADFNLTPTEAQKHHWLRADPVHLRADQQFLRLFDASVLNIQASESAALTQHLNAFYANETDALTLTAPAPTRWYAKLTHHQQLNTHSLESVRGLPIHNHLLTGADARWWHSRWTEIQMLLHQHPINSARETSGQFSLNSLWFWGEGQLTAAPTKHWQQVYSNDPLAIGISRWSQTPHSPPPETAQALLAQAPDGRLLCQLPHAQNTPEQLEEHWFAPLLTALRHKHLQSLWLYPGNGRSYQLTAYYTNRFWKRTHPWFTQLCPNS